jgi:RNA polymerase sigma-70 factor (ECF subfamily)
MGRIERVQHTHEVYALEGASHVGDFFAKADLPQLDISSRGKKLCPIDEVRKSSDAALFLSHRDRLLRIACRMLGSRDDAEDLVQDVYLRWHQSDKRSIESPIAFLITITGRLCLDRLRELKRQRTESLDAGLLERVVDDHMPCPEMRIVFADEVSNGFLTVLERLGPEERIAFLLHDVLDYDYGEVGKVLSRADSACRQLIHRARARLRDPRARFAITPECHERVLKRFLAAIGGDRAAVIALLAEEVELLPRRG